MQKIRFWCGQLLSFSPCNHGGCNNRAYVPVPFSPAFFVWRFRSLGDVSWVPTYEGVELSEGGWEVTNLWLRNWVPQSLLLGGFTSEKIWVSIMRNPRYGKTKKMFQTTNQIRWWIEPCNKHRLKMTKICGHVGLSFCHMFHRFWPIPIHTMDWFQGTSQVETMFFFNQDFLLGLREFSRDPIWLVVGSPLWKIWTSIGMISNPILMGK